ncbi:MAG: AAA family ATPase [Anaerolineales bacterium]|nr:AAA family ATPase [Anaerolineales bacterium]
MVQVEIHTLGSFQVKLQEEVVNGFGSDNVRLLLAYLAVEPCQPVRREALAGLFWPDANPATARANLRWALSNLRKALKDETAQKPLLLIDSHSIQRNPEASLWCDAAEFLTLHRRATLSLHQLEDLAHLYQGEFLAGIQPRNSLPLEEWLLLKREQLARQLVELLESLIERYQQQGNYRQAIPYARRLVKVEPWQEHGQRQLMRLLESAGQRNAALEQYLSYKSFAAQTLGVEPETETNQLFEQIRQKDCTSSVPAPAHHNLNQLLPALIGRQAELETIRGWLLDPNNRAVIITGPGGSGKTHLGFETAKTLLEHYRDGVYFVDLETLTPRHSIVPAIAEALHFIFARGTDLGAQLLDYLADKHMLLVLDNFEHLQEQTGTVVALLGHAPGLKMLITSRARVNIPASQSCPLGGLALPRDNDLGTKSSAIELFCASVRRIHPAFDPEPEEFAAIIEICHLVDGLPLGILLAANRTEIMPLIEIAAAIRQNAALLATTRSEFPRHHHSMQAVMQSSWDVLDAQAQETLACLSVCRGDFSSQAAQQIGDASRMVLQYLINQSLLHWSGGGRLRMHALLRRYAANRLADRPEIEQLAGANHSHYYLEALAQWGQTLKGPDQQNALEQVRSDYANILAAWDWAARHGKHEELLAAVDGLCWYLLWQVLYEEGAWLCQTSLAALAGPDPHQPTGQRLRIRLLAWQGRFLQLLGEKGRGHESLKMAQAELERAFRDNAEMAFEQGLIWYLIGKAVESQDRPAARDLYQRSLDLFQQSGYTWEAAHLLSHLGGIAWNMGAYSQAEHYHYQAWQARFSLEDERGIANSSMALGMTSLYQGKFAEALTQTKHGCHLRRQVGDRLGIADSLRNLGWTHLFLGDFQQAVALLTESVSIYQSLGLRYGLEMSMLAHALAHQGSFEKAVEWCERGLEAARATGYRRALGQTLLRRGELALVFEETDLARQKLQESLEIHQQIGQQEALCQAWIGLALAEMQSGDLSKAGAALQKAHQLLRAQRAFTAGIYFVPVVAKWLRLNGDVEPAQQWAQLVSGSALIQNSDWFQQVCDAVITRVSAKPNLDPEMLWQQIENPLQFE